MRRILAIGTATALVVVVAGGVLVDTALSAERTSRRLTLAQRDVGGLDEPELRAAVDQLATDLRSQPVTLRSPEGDESVPSGSLGLTIDREAVVAEAREIDHGGPALLRPLQVLRSWFVDRTVPVRFTVERAELDRGVRDAVRADGEPPTEPNIELDGNTFRAVPGREGTQLDVEDLASRLTGAAAGAPEGPWTVEVPVRTVAPRFSLADAERLAERANSVAESALIVEAGGKRTTVPARKVRSWLRAVATDDELELQADVEAVVRDVTDAVGTVGTQPEDATFRVSGDTVEIVGGQPGTRCCAPDTGARVAEAVLEGRRTVTLDVIEAPPKRDRAWAEKLGIKEKVATFTTQHPAGQPRVTNIHLAADALRGSLVEPGTTFSLNKTLGQRTREKGYVEDGVIYAGTMAKDVGGGISQLATTLFNAAFFAGLEFRTYQSHTLYISRYPYGREATISWPSPDLSFRNPTPHGLLLWTSYDASSITVTIYSTKWATAEQTNQTTEPSGACTRVRTERTLTFVAGGKKVDQVTALYQPEDGILCDGRRVERPEDTTVAPAAPPPAPPGAPSPAPASSTTAAPAAPAPEPTAAKAAAAGPAG